MNGWIKLHRQLLDSPIWTMSPPTHLKVFIACLLLRLERRRLERHITTAFDSDLSRRRDQIIVAQEALGGEG